MKTLKNRKIDFRFDDDIPFDWNPGNTGVGNVVNYASMIAPAFEKYFIRVTRQALPMIKSPEVLANAKEFCAQEGTHARHHNAHMGMLIRKYSGLEAAQKKVAASYDRIFEERNLEFHAAYMINLEDWFGPVALLAIDHRDALFGAGDPRISSFMLWHLIEEFEHRSSAHAIYHELVPSPWPRLRHLPAVIGHIIEVRQYVLDGFLEHVPIEDNPTRASLSGLVDGVSWRCRLKFLARMLAALAPSYEPTDLQEPEWATQWFRDEEDGQDMSCYFPRSGPAPTNPKAVRPLEPSEEPSP